jgi:hypothetical protein
MELPNDFERALRLFESHIITWNELQSRVWDCVFKFPKLKDEIFNKVLNHPNEDVQRCGQLLHEQFQRSANRVTDIEQIRRTSPLQPGTRVEVGGGYTSLYSSPVWLDGREFRAGTFVDFLPAGPGKMPVALLELDEEYKSEKHNGRYLVLRLYFVADWTEGETVEVFVVAEPLVDAAALLEADDSVETHATYIVEEAATR